MPAFLSHKLQILPCHILFPTNYRSCHITYYFPQITDPAISHKYYFLPYHILFTIITLLILHIGLQIKNQYWYTMYK
jgi:hypothetical protein